MNRERALCHTLGSGIRSARGFSQKQCKKRRQEEEGNGGFNKKSFSEERLYPGKRSGTKVLGKHQSQQRKGRGLGGKESLSVYYGRETYARE